MRDVFNNPTDVYTIKRSEKDAVSAVLLPSSVLSSLLASINPTSSLPVKIKYLQLPSEAAAKRFEEVYDLVLAATEVSLNSGKPVSFGFQHKIDVEGQQADFEVETHLSGGGKVTSNFPILSGSVSAVKLPSLAALSVTSVNGALGSVSLHDGANPIADGVSVQLVYQTTDYLAYLIKDESNHQNEAAVISQALYSYLLAHQ
jgi:hypothetical protein